MSRLMAIDFGLKRIGIAVTDPLRIIVTPLITVPAHTIMEFLTDYLNKEKVEKLILGWPLRSDGSLNPISVNIDKFATELRKKFPSLEIVLVDESLTSKRAAGILSTGGFKKKIREKKENLDKLSAAILLEDYLETQKK